jgi:hypothetical protein
MATQLEDFFREMERESKRAVNRTIRQEKRRRVKEYFERYCMTPISGVLWSALVMETTFVMLLLVILCAIVYFAIYPPNK